MPVVNDFMFKVGTFAPDAHYLTPGPEDGVQERTESFHLSDFVEHMCAECFQGLHFLGDDLHVAESLHPMTAIRIRTSIGG